MDTQAATRKTTFMMDSRYFFMDVILSSLRGWFQPFFGVWVEIVEIWVRDVPVGANMIRPLVYHSSGTSCHLLYKRRLSQIVSSLEEMPGRAEESARANTVRPYGGIGILHILHGFRFTIPCRDRCPHLSAVTSYPFHTRRDKRRTLFYFDSSADHSVISPV